MTASIALTATTANKKSLFAAIGPGIVWASTSIGVSHVVQSTRAGADFGFTLIGLIILANVIKYPFFQMGPRYAASTGESLLEGYQKVGRWAFYCFLLITALTMFFVQAGVTIVASGLAANLISDSIPVSAWAALISASIVFILLVGRYALLDSLLKIMMLIFATVTIFTVIAALTTQNQPTFTSTPDITLTSAASIAFIVALIGWMPTSIEVSVWHSLWTISRHKQTSHKPTVKEAVFDFNFGFIFCMLFALLFLTLGATLLYGSQESFSGSAIGFTAQLIGLYVGTLGDWSWGFIALVTFIAMYSTCLAVADGFSEVWSRSLKMLAPNQPLTSNVVYLVILLTLSFGGWMIINYFGSSLKQLVDFATTVSFVSAPVFAFLNLKAMSLSHVPVNARLNNKMIRYSWISLTILTGFALFYLYWRFIG